jgi:cytochrome oxidase Cu insertion factor (SCO1/SenC/PrrC family)
MTAKAWAVPKIIAKFQKSDLVEIGPVPEFKLTNQKNKSISNKDYLGKVYVVEFFFATCPTICPKMNQSMLQLQDEFYGNPSFGLVSITIDPSNDTPQFLDEHARMLGVKHYNWNFLTGDKEYIFNLANKGTFGEDIKNGSQNIIQTKQSIILYIVVYNHPRARRHVGGYVCRYTTTHNIHTVYTHLFVISCYNNTDRVIWGIINSYQ